VISKFNLRTVYGKKSWEAARVKLASNTTIAEDRKSGLIVISVFDRDPERAAGLAAEYVTELNLVTRELSTSSARREREFLAGRLVEVEKDLETAEKDLSEFASRNSAIDIKEQGRALVDAAALLQGQLIAGESELEGLKQVYADGNVRVRTLSARVAALRAQLAKLGGEDPVGRDLAGQDPDNQGPIRPARASNDRGEEHSLYPSIRKLPLLGVPYADLYRRTKVQEAVFETLTQEYELAKVAEAKQTPSVKVLDPANLPETRFLPLHFFSGALLGACLAMAAGAAWLFTLARWHRTADDDPRKLLLREIFASARARMRSLHAGGEDIAASPWGRVGGSVSARVNARFRRSEGHEIIPEDGEFRS
jgi:capsule polysaccharide export protein KpsE/RkpR